MTARILRRSRSESEFRKDGLPGRAHQESQKGIGLGLIAAGRDNSGFLDDGRVPFGGNQTWFAIFDEREGSQNDVGVAAIEKLQGLADILPIYDFLPEGRPEP